jgi:hypothetical protein
MCMKTCINKEVALNADCTGCYINVVLCTINMCLTPCLVDANSPACTQCQVEKGCLPTFFMCSGLPSGAPDGGAPGGDGGGPDAPASEGGTTTPDAAVTPDASAG